MLVDGVLAGWCWDVAVTVVGVVAVTVAGVVAVTVVGVLLSVLRSCVCGVRVEVESCRPMSVVRFGC